MGSSTQSVTMASSKMGALDTCYMCGTNDSVVCDKCESVSYCEVHSKYHKLGLNGSCSPYKVVEIEGAGRGLVATRDITKGEHIMTTHAAAMGPCARTGAQ